MNSIVDYLALAGKPVDEDYLILLTLNSVGLSIEPIVNSIQVLFLLMMLLGCY